MSQEVAQNRFTVVFAGGGTGGHLMPGITVAQELGRRFPNSRAVFVGTVSSMDRRIVESHGLQFFGLPSLKLSNSALDTPGWMIRASRGIIAAGKLLQKLRPDVVVSLGGYAAVAPSIAAALRRVPIVVLEQNAVPGKANRLLSWWAQEVYVPWPGTEISFPHAERVHVTGNPVRQYSNFRCNRKLAERFGLRPRKRTLLIMGGSQGARFINETVVALLPCLDQETTWLQILHSTGAAHLDVVRAAYQEHTIQAAIYPYIEDMISAYGLCDLALCRAGGTTMAELTALGLPAIVVPLPSAANNHQRRNAEVVAREGGAIIMEQNDIRSDKLAKQLLHLLRSEPELTRMREAALRIGRPAAAANVADRIMGVMLDRMPSSEMMRHSMTADRRT